MSSFSPAQSPAVDAADEYTDFVIGQLESWPLHADGRRFDMLEAYDRIARTFQFVVCVEASAMKCLRLWLPVHIAPPSLLPRFVQGGTESVRGLYDSVP